MTKKTPPVQRTREVPLQVRITPDERELYKAAAQADNRSLSNWVRARLSEAAQQKPGGK